MIDPSIAGTVIGETRFPVERSKLYELARTLHDPDPVYWDPQAASTAGFDTIPTPPTVTALKDHWISAGIEKMISVIGADLKRTLHGEASWEYLVPIKPGDELTATQKVADVTTREGKRGGSMTLVTIETEFTNQDGQVAVRQRDVLIETGG